MDIALEGGGRDGTRHGFPYSDIRIDFITSQELPLPSIDIKFLLHPISDFSVSPPLLSNDQHDDADVIAMRRPAPYSIPPVPPHPGPVHSPPGFEYNLCDEVTCLRHRGCRWVKHIFIMSRRYIISATPRRPCCKEFLDH